MLAARVPEMALEEAEAKLVAEAIGRVSRHYPQVSALLSGKIADHIALFTAVSAVYGTRLVAINARMNKEKAPAPIASVITMMPNAGPFSR